MTFFSLLLLLLLALSSVGLTLSTCFVPIFTSDGNLVSGDAGGGMNITRGEITIWEMHLWVQRPDGRVVRQTTLLRQSYFTCDNGRVRIQVVEGISLLASVLACVNLVLSSFNFSASSIFRVPLALYFMFSSMASLIVLILEVDWYKNNWCESQPALSSDAKMNWVFGVGWRLIIASLLSSCAGFCLAAAAF